MKQMIYRRIFRLFTILFVTAALCLPSPYCGAGLRASAEQDPPIPQAAQDFYYNDQADLLSGETRALILTKNAELSPQSIQLVVLTMDALPVSGYTQRVEYLRRVMDSWGVGGSQGRGLILGVSASDEDYIAVAGEGLQSLFTTDLLKALLDAQLEPDFSARSYDAGISKFITEAAAQAQAWAATPQGEPAPSNGQDEGGVPVLLWVAIAAGAAAVVCAAVFILAGRPSRHRYGSRRSVHRHAPLVTPPRTNVLRHENHTPMIIKSAHRDAQHGGSPTRIKKL